MDLDLMDARRQLARPWRAGVDDLALDPDFGVRGLGDELDRAGRSRGLRARRSGRLGLRLDL
jgi:hypothetical protein